MFLLNLGLGEFLALFGALSGVVVALYLLDRSRRKIVVATLRFWKPAERPPDVQHRRHIQQPVSLLLQILGILLLLLAIAQLRLGSPERASRDHILLLDTSAWMAARGRQATLMDEAKSYARAWLRSLPSSDRVMLVRVDAVATPVTAFETNRQAIEDAIRQSTPGAAALSLVQMFDFARQIRRVHSRRSGEVVYAGPGRIPEAERAELPPAPPDLRILPVTEGSPNCGLRKISLRRSLEDPSLWEVFVSVRNYGAQPRTLPLTIHFGGAPMGSTRVTLPPASDQGARFEFRTRAAGWLEVRLHSRDAMVEDDRALLELPEEKPVEIAVYTDEPGALRPLIGANPLVHAVYHPTSAYNARQAEQAQIVVLDRLAPRPLPAGNVILIQPPGESSPVRIAANVSGAQLSGWASDHPVASGLHTRDLKLEQAQVFARTEDTVPIARVESGPVLVASKAEPRRVVFGFHPGKSALRLELAAPLLFGNIVQWMAPDAVRQRELTGTSVGTIAVTLDTAPDPASVKVLGEDSRPLPFTLHDRMLRFFGGSPGIVRVLTGGREMVYSLTLPEVAEATWEFPPQARRGIPARSRMEASSRDLWQLLAVLGGLCLLAEWLVYGRIRAVLTARKGPSHLLRLPLNLFRKAS